MGKNRRYPHCVCLCLLLIIYHFLGKRNCSGESLARSTFFHYFVTLLQHFTLEPVPGKYPSSKVKPSSHTLAPLPFDVIIKNRK